MKAVTITTAQDFPSTMSHQLLLAESPFQDTVIYLYIEKPMDIHQGTFTRAHLNDHVSEKFCG